MPLPTIVTFSNIGYLDFAKNFILSFLLNTSKSKLDFYCLDNEIYDALKSFLNENESRIVLSLFNDSISKKFENYGSLEYNKIMGTKINVILDSLKKYFYIHFADSDIVFLREPTEEYYSKYSEYDITFQPDCASLKPFALWACAGNMTIRDTPGTANLINKIVEYQSKYPNKNDQECMYQYFLDLNLKDIREYTDAKLYEYPREDFANGHAIQNNLVDISKIMIFHANYVVGKPPKIKLLKQVSGWFI